MAESGQIAFRPQGQSTCVHHKGKALNLFCEKCQDVACTKCVTTVHRGHLMCDLSDITPRLAEDIGRFVEDTERNKLPHSQKNIQSTINELEKNSEYFYNLATGATNQAYRMKQEIDIMTAENLSLYQQLQEENARLLTDYKCELEKGHTELRQQLEECKRLLQTASDIAIFDARDRVNRYGVQLPDKPILRTASFDPTKSFRGLLEQAFGKRTISGTRTKQPTLTYTLLPEVKVMGHHKTEFKAYSVFCNQSNEACICYRVGSYSNLQVLDTNFKNQNKTLIPTVITDISIARKTNNAWATDGKENCIIECTTAAPIVRFRTEEKPQCLCVTKDNHVLVGVPGRITKFCMDGRAILTTDMIKLGRSVVSNPQRIRECRVTNNVAVVDIDMGKNGDVSGGRVLVLNKDLQDLLCYTGAIPTGLHRKRRPFNPSGVAYDSVGNIVIADFKNNCILLLDGAGQFIRIIHTSKYRPRAIDVDNNNILWLAYVNGHMERVQYCTC